MLDITKAIKAVFYTAKLLVKRCNTYLGNSPKQRHGINEIIKV
jgi:hypothetical protein